MNFKDRAFKAVRVVSLKLTHSCRTDLSNAAMA